MRSTDPDPVLSSLRLRTSLRNARDVARLSQGVAGTRLRWSAKKIYRIESGETPASAEDVLKLADLYGVDPERTHELVALAEARYGTAWWEEYRELVSAEFGLFLSCERAASRLCSFHPTLVQGLVQTEEYARAVLESTTSPLFVHRHVRLRRERRETFDRPQPPRTTIVLGEAALRNQVGSAETMRRQLLELRAIATAGGPIELGIVPFEECLYPAMLLAFDMARLPDDTVMLYLELPPVSRTTKDEPVLNDLFNEFFEQIVARASFGADAAALIDATLGRRVRGDCEQR